MIKRHDRRLAALAPSTFFLPLGITHTDAAPGWIEGERRRNVTADDQFLIFMWSEPA